MKNLRIEIQRVYERNAIKVWLIEDIPDGQNVISQENGEMVVNHIPAGEAISLDMKPFLNLPAQFANTLFQAIAEYNSAEGKRTKDENLLEGKLEATQLHLEDMREMTKLLVYDKMKKVDTDK